MKSDIFTLTYVFRERTHKWKNVGTKNYNQSGKLRNNYLDPAKDPT